MDFWPDIFGFISNFSTNRAEWSRIHRNKRGLPSQLKSIEYTEGSSWNPGNHEGKA